MSVTERDPGLVRCALGWPTTRRLRRPLPDDPAGRTIGIVLMIAGVGIFGVVAASAAAWFISADQRQDRHQQAETITTLTAEITDVLAFGELFDTFATLRSLIIANDRLLACGE